MPDGDPPVRSTQSVYPVGAALLRAALSFEVFRGQGRPQDGPYEYAVAPHPSALWAATSPQGKVFRCGGSIGGIATPVWALARDDR